MVKLIGKSRPSMPRSGIVHILLLLLFPLSGPALGIDPARSMSQYVHQAWQTDQGLPQNSVVSITQTRDGYIWLATQEGLARFDGVRFTVFNKQNTERIKENNIQALCADRNEGLWAGTEGGGLIRLRGGNFISYTTKDGLPSDIVDAVYQDSRGDVFIGTPDGLAVFRQGSSPTVTPIDSFKNQAVLAIFEDGDANIWIGTDGRGLTRLSPASSEGTTYTTRDGLLNDSVRSICEDRAGNLWIGTRGGLARLKDGKFSGCTAKNGLPNNSVLSTYEDRDGNLWIGTDGSGLVRFRGGQFASFTTREGLSDDGVASIYEDSEGDLWIGTYGGGLNRLKDGKFTVYTTENGLPSDMVRSVFEDSKANIWFGTRNGLVRLKDGGFTTYTTKDGLAGNSVLSFCEDSEGDLWVGTRDGLNRLSKGKIFTYTIKDGLPDNVILALCPGADGGVWIGTSGGLSRLTAGKVRTYTVKEGLTDNAVWSICEARDGTLWLGTDGGGLNSFRDGKFKGYTTKDGFVNDVVLSLYEDARSVLWIGTSGGLGRLEAGKFTAYTTREGLFDDVVFQILEDGAGNLWMSCNRGVFRVAVRDLELHTAGNGGFISSVSYGTADGLKSRECNGGTQPAGWKSRDGRLWFPTIKGVAVIDPDHVRLNRQPPPVVIEQVLVDSRQVDPLGGLRLTAGKTKFEFRYAALSYQASGNVRFRYKLEGFDKDWVEAEDKREASYTNIPPGRYGFRVIACNNDGIWNLTGARLDFYLAPHFYETYWFYGLCVLVVGLLGWVLYRQRMRQVKARFSAVLAERNRIARDLHDTFEQGFTGVGLELEAAAVCFAQAPGLARQHLDAARHLVRQSRAEARLSVWDLRSRVLEHGGVVSAISEIANQLTASSSMTARVKASGAPADLPEMAEKTLLRVGQEAITNAVKHSSARNIEVDLSFTDKSALMRIKDDGVGFEVAASLAIANGLGLRGMRERAEQAGGRLTVTSRPNDGTEIVLEMPIA